MSKECYLQKIRTFILKVNKVSCRIDFSAPFGRFLQPVWELSNLIDEWNDDFFRMLGFKLELIMFQVYFLKNKILLFFKDPKRKLFQL